MKALKDNLFTIAFWAVLISLFLYFNFYKGKSSKSTGSSSHVESKEDKIWTDNLLNEETYLIAIKYGLSSEELSKIEEEYSGLTQKQKNEEIVSIPKAIEILSSKHNISPQKLSSMLLAINYGMSEDECNDSCKERCQDYAEDMESPDPPDY